MQVQFMEADRWCSLKASGRVFINIGTYSEFNSTYKAIDARRTG
jgi:hypothetical protein